MRTQNLATWEHIRTNAVNSLDTSRPAATDAADWLRSDRKPDSPVPATAGDARAEVCELVSQIKELTGRAKTGTPNGAVTT